MALYGCNYHYEEGYNKGNEVGYEVGDDDGVNIVRIIDGYIITNT